MLSLTLIAVGFVVTTAVVIALARGSTARWEEHKRSSVAVRTGGPARRASPAGAALTMPGALTRRGLAALRGRASRFPPVRVLTRVLPELREQGTSRVLPLRRLAGVVRSSPFGSRLGGAWRRKTASTPSSADDEANTSLAGESSATEDGVLGDGGAGAARDRVLRRPLARAPRRALALLHRHGPVKSAPVRHEGRDESPTAR
jgi:hypothetical protein